MSREKTLESSSLFRVTPQLVTVRSGRLRGGLADSLHSRPSSQFACVPQHAAINDIGTAGDVGGLRRYEKGYDRRNFLWAANPTKGNLSKEPGEKLRIMEGFPIDRCCDRARCHIVDCNPVWGQLEANRAHEHAQAPLRGAVGGVSGHWQILVDRGDVHDPSALTLTNHLLGCCLGAEVCSLEVDRQHTIVIGLRCFKE